MSNINRKLGWIKRKKNGFGIAWNKGLSSFSFQGEKNPNWKGGEIKKECKQCNKKFFVRQYRKDSASYCSQNCSHKARVNTENPVNYAIRRRQIYLDWRKSIMERDNYTCQDCGVKNRKGLGKTVVLNVDHLKPLAQIVKENNLKTIEDMLYCEELWNINNGRTLCYPCHKKTPTYGRTKLYRECIASA